jgi:hypothetical protein
LSNLKDGFCFFPDFAFNVTATLCRFQAQFLQSMSTFYQKYAHTISKVSSHFDKSMSILLANSLYLLLKTYSPFSKTCSSFGENLRWVFKRGETTFGASTDIREASTFISLFTPSLLLLYRTASSFGTSR